MTDFITSDLHFGHPNIMKFCPATRKFRDVAHMESEMIRMWNESVQPTDTVYILGDVSFADARKTVEILKALHGRKILIEGNHDSKLMRDTAFRAQFAEIYKYHEINVLGLKVVMFHYPIYDHNGAHRGSIMLHGHRHGNPTGISGRIKDIGFDATGKIVSNLDTIVREMLDITPMSHH